MKGLDMPEEIGMTMILLLVVVALVVFMLLIFLIMQFPGSRAEQIAYSVDFASIANKPFLVAEILSQVQIGDRSFFEQSIEVTTTNSLQDASSLKLTSDIKNFLSPYKLRSYFISLTANEEIFSIENQDYKCGEKMKGWCVDTKLTGYTCDVGRVEIDAKGFCKTGQVCCNYDPAAYASVSGTYPINSCANGRGVCSEGRRGYFWYGSPIPVPIPTTVSCDAGEAEMSSSDCENNGNTKVCCLPIDQDTAEITGLAITATVPLLYKNLIYGKLEVTTK